VSLPIDHTQADVWVGAPEVLSVRNIIEALHWAGVQA